MIQQEHIEQCALFQWINYNIGKYSELALAFAIPNGGKRNIGTAVKMKREGVKPGIPDIFLPCARSGWHGLFIEMKAKGGAVTPIQLKIHEALMENDYKVCVCFSFEHAKTELIMYLAGEK